MYYESICHTERKVSGPIEAAEIIKSGNVQEYEALSWEVADGTIYAVSDVHIDDTPFGETAMILKQDDKFYLVESITVGWCDAQKTAKHFFNASTERAIKRPTQLIFGKPLPEQKGNFTCGCCGEWFNDFVAVQLLFHQDAGYGICSECKRYYS